MTRYLTPTALKELCDQKTGAFMCTIRFFQREIIAGRPNLVMYIEEDPRGIVLTRRLYDDLRAAFGEAPPEIAEFFATEGLQ